MSLTSFLIQNGDVRERFRLEFGQSPFRFNRRLLAPPRTKNYSLVGTAFDYLLRLYITYWNSHRYKRGNKKRVYEKDLVADTAPEIALEWEDYTLAEKCMGMLDEARDAFAIFVRSGKMTDHIIKSAIGLAQMDVLYRAQLVPPDLGQYNRGDVADLKRLCGIIDPHHWTVRKICLLNPTFSGASLLVGGADADLILDDALIEIKTTQEPAMSGRCFQQLMGYYTLWKIANTHPRTAIKRIGVYFSRHAYMHFIDLDDIVNPKTLPAFQEWFAKRARSEFA